MRHLALAPATRPATAAVIDRLPAVVRRWWHNHQEKRRLRETAHILQGLDDRILRDIGLNRSEIESMVATQGAERRLRYL